MALNTAHIKKRLNSAINACASLDQRQKYAGWRWVRFGMMTLLLAACGSGAAPTAVPQPTSAIAPSATPVLTPAPVATSAATSRQPIIATSVAATVRAVVATQTAATLPTPTVPATLGKAAARITSPASGAVLAGEWTDVYGEVSCARSEIEYWKFEFEDGGFIARFMPGMFARNMLMHWKTASIAALIGNNQTRNVRVVVVCKDGSVLVSPSVTYTFKQ